MRGHRLRAIAVLAPIVALCTALTAGRAVSDSANACHDGGAFGRIVERRGYLSSDLSHLSVTGHAKAAAVAGRR